MRRPTRFALRFALPFGVVTLALAGLTACTNRTDRDAAVPDGTEAPAAPPPATPPADASGFAPALGVDLGASTRTPSGLYVRDLTVGTGPEATAGQTVSVHYTGWLPDGTEFDSSRRSGQPLAFPLGAGMVIPGWDEGVAGMRVGGRRQLVIPPDLAYGPGGNGPIPPNATLVFDVELLGVQ